MEIRYDRDLRHNYMVLCGVANMGDYRLKMLAENRPRGLLGCSLRNINGQGYLYYEIDSRQPIRNRYGGGLMTEEDLRRLLQAIRELQLELEDYLLDAEHVLFSTDCVYTDVRSGIFSFVYCPFDEQAAEAQTGPFGTGFSGFAEELLSLISEEDEAAVRTGYLLCELAASGEMLLSDILRTALEIREMADSEAQDVAPCALDEPERIPDIPTAARVPYPEEDDEEEQDKGSPRNGMWWIALAVLFIAVFVGNLYIRYRFWLDTRENILSLATAGVSILMAVLSGACFFRSGKAASSSSAKGAEELPQEDWIRPVLPEMSVDRVQTEGENTRPSATGYPRGHSMPVRAALNRSAGGWEGASQDEETTVLCEEDLIAGHKLYSRGGGRTINIELDHLPFTVGKLAGCVDFCIQDPSVSRMHTRFLGDASGAVSRMQDLNSTNGTFLNGRRLKPNEIVSIRPGDEIGMGHLAFEFL